MHVAGVLITLYGVVQAAPQDTSPRNWDVGDPAVRFVEGTTSPLIRPLGEWTRPVSISVRCTVQADGSLEACEVVAESPPRRLSHSSARRGVGKMRLLLGEAGPRPGDTLTVEVGVATHWR